MVEHNSEDQIRRLLIIVHLTFGKRFEQSLKNSLPSSLTHLSFLGRYRISINHLPPKLLHLDIGLYSLKGIKISRNYPPSLVFLSLGLNQPLDDLPTTLTHLHLYCNFNKPISNLPPKLTLLTIDGRFNQPINPLLPGLTHLCFCYDSQFNQPLINLPSTLIRLTFGTGFNQPIDCLPPVSYLKLGRNFNQNLDSLPSSLTKLNLAFIITNQLTLFHLHLQVFILDIFSIILLILSQNL